MEVASAGENRIDKPNMKELKSGPAVVSSRPVDGEEGTVTTLLFTIAVSATYRGAQEIYSAQVLARNGDRLYHLAEAASISGALEKLAQEMRLQENSGAASR